MFDGTQPLGAVNCKDEKGHTSYDDAILPNDFFDYNPYRSIISEVVWSVKGQVNVVGAASSFNDWSIFPFQAWTRRPFAPEADLTHFTICMVSTSLQGFNGFIHYALFKY